MGREFFDGLVDEIVERIAERLPSEQEPRWLTSAEAADHLRMSLDGLHRLTGAGAVPHVKQGNRLLFDREELDEWLKAHSVGSAPFPRRYTTRGSAHGH